MTEQQHRLAIAHLPVQRLHFQVQTKGSMKLPDYAGSMLRGAFGHAFRKLSCMTRQKTCNACPLLSSCPYSLVFETPANQQTPLLQAMAQAPKPYVIEPPRGGYRRLESGDQFEFSMVLIGQAISQLPLILLAWERALENGLGHQNQACQLLRVHQGNPDMPIYRPGSPIQELAPPRNSRINWQQRQQIILNLTSPLRIQQRGKLVGTRELNARTLLVNMARRYQTFASLHLPTAPDLDFRQLSDAASALQLTTHLRWIDYERFSSRQQQATPLGGLVGEIQLQGDLEPWGPLLELGQHLHLGKETTFGLGHYQLQENSHLNGPTNANANKNLCEQPA